MMSNSRIQIAATAITTASIGKSSEPKQKIHLALYTCLLCVCLYVYLFKQLLLPSNLTRQPRVFPMRARACVCVCVHACVHVYICRYTVSYH